MKRRLAAVFAALVMTMLLAVPAFAVELTNATPISSDNAGLQGTTAECAEFNVQPGQVVWHFVQTKSDDQTETLTATFQNAGTKTATPYKTSPDQDTADHWTLHYAITTGSPDTLLSASATGGDGLQLSHICNGGPPPEIPEAPASVLLILTAGLAGLGFMSLRRRNRAVA